MCRQCCCWQGKPGTEKSQHHSHSCKCWLGTARYRIQIHGTLLWPHTHAVQQSQIDSHCPQGNPCMPCLCWCHLCTFQVGTPHMSHLSASAQDHTSSYTPLWKSQTIQHRICTQKSGCCQWTHWFPYERDSAYRPRHCLMKPCTCPPHKLSSVTRCPSSQACKCNCAHQDQCGSSSHEHGNHPHQQHTG